MDNLSLLVSTLVDVLTISETKLDSSFPKEQFHLPNFKAPYRLDISCNSGGLLTFVRSDIPSRRLLEFSFPDDIQIVPIELTLKRQKWLLFNVYKPPKQTSQFFLDTLTKAILFYSKYDNIMINGDLNLEPKHPEIVNFLKLNSMYNHMKEITCWKSQSGSCIDLIISNRKHSLMNTGTFETGLSDHHLLIFTMLKTTYEALPPKIIKYRKWKNFDDNLFRYELTRHLKFNVINNYSSFEKIFTNILDKHAPIKTKFIRGNNKQHLTKNLRKAIMKRSKLKNIANKTKSPEDFACYKKQRNLVVNMNRQARKSYFTGTISGTNCFWKAVKPYFGSKSSDCEERILLVENNEVVNNEGELSFIFNQYFNRITDDLDIPIIPVLTSTDPNPVSNAITKYATHPSIVAIKTKANSYSQFELKPIKKDIMTKEILALNTGKSVSGSISSKALQLAAIECADALTSIFNSWIIDKSIFPDELKIADIIPVHKKNSTTNKANYRPISLLPIVSKVFERIIAKQIEPFINTWLSKLLCGFRKSFSTQHSIINMIRKWQSCLNTSGRVGAVLMDLSKAFDCLPHDLLVAKLAAYGFGVKTLNLFHSYLSGRKHRVRVGSIVSDLLEIFLGVPQGSVLGPILFNIFINDLLFVVQESICNFADDNTLYICGTNITDITRRINKDLEIVLHWFTNNGMVANPDKFQAIFLGNTNNNITLNIGSTKITGSNEVKLLGVTIDRQLTFYPHITNICAKASAKTKALMRIRKFLTQKQADFLYTAFIMSPFNYCPLVWLFCSKMAHNLIDKTHHKALCVRFNNFKKTFEELLLSSCSITVHTKNLQLLVIEVFKSLHHLNPEFMWNSFILKPEIYHLRQGQSLVIPRARSTSALNTLDFRAALAWNHLPSKIKHENSLSKFRCNLKTHKIYCKCKYCT